VNEAYMSEKEPYISAKEPYISVKEPYIFPQKSPIYIGWWLIKMLQPMYMGLF